MRKNDPPFEEILGSLRSLFEAEREVAEEGRVIETKVDRTHAAQGELKAQLGRLEVLLTDILAGQAEMRDRLDALESQQREHGRLEDLVLRLVARLPLAGLSAEGAHDTLN